MNINDYKDVNGNVEVSETLVSDIIDEVNTHEADMAVKTSTLNTSLPTDVNRIRRSGNVVTIEFYSSGPVTGYTTFATVPVGYRPSTTVRLFASLKIGDTLANYMASVNEYGEIIQLLTSGVVTGINITGTYII